MMKDLMSYDGDKSFAFRRKLEYGFDALTRQGRGNQNPVFRV